MQYFFTQRIAAKKAFIMCLKFLEKETCCLLQLDAEDILVRRGNIFCVGFHSNPVKQEMGHTRGLNQAVIIEMKWHVMCLPKFSVKYLIKRQFELDPRLACELKTHYSLHGL